MIIKKMGASTLKLPTDMSSLSLDFDMVVPTSFIDIECFNPIYMLSFGESVKQMLYVILCNSIFAYDVCNEVM